MSPNGTAHAIALVAKVRDTDIPASAAMYEELVLQRALTRDQCLQLFRCLEEIAAAYVQEARGQRVARIEERRFHDARAALAIEHAFLAGTATGDLPVAFRDTSAAAAAQISTFSAVEAITRTESNISKPHEAVHSSIGVTGPVCDHLLGLFVPFHELLSEDWATLPKQAQDALTAVDTLELDGSRAVTAAARRVLFAEAGRLMERFTDPAGSRLVSQSTLLKDVRAACCWRLSRHYVLGLGIDTTDHQGRMSSDLQACEYLMFRHGGQCASLKAFQGLTQSLGRCEVPYLHTFNVLHAAAEAGVPAAAFWMASLKLEGWGQLAHTTPPKGSVSVPNGVRTRHIELQEARAGFVMCQEFSFLKEVSASRIAVVDHFLADEFAAVHRHYPLATYVFAQSIRDLVQSFVPRMLFLFVKEYSVKQELPGPPDVAADQPMPQWVPELQKRACRSLSVHAFDNCSDAVEKAKEASLGSNRRAAARQQNQYWVRQNLGQAFVVPASETANKTWNLTTWAALLQALDSTWDKLQTAVTIFDGKKAPVVAFSERIASIAGSAPAIDSFLATQLSQTVLTNTWDSALATAKTTYQSIEPRLRFLSEQQSTYDDALQMLKSSAAVTQAHACANSADSSSSSTDTCSSDLQAVLSVVRWGRYLATVAGDVEVTAVGKHADSAAAVLTYALETAATDTNDRGNQRQTPQDRFQRAMADLETTGKRPNY